MLRQPQKQEAETHRGKERVVWRGRCDGEGMAERNIPFPVYLELYYLKLTGNRNIERKTERGVGKPGDTGLM